MTVHGEREVVPSATRDEAAQALTDFTNAYNKADKAYDPALDEGRVTGALGAVNQAGLKARRVQSPDGNARHRPLVLDDAKYTIPKKAGWPRWFVADTDSDRDAESGPRDTRWLVVFVKSGPDALWEASYLTVVAPGDVPEFELDGDGYARTVPVDSDGLAVAPKDLSERYAGHLGTGKPDAFAPGTHTTGIRDFRRTHRRAGFSFQYVDQALDTGDFAPLGLATKDGGALVFFSTRHFERQTAAKGLKPELNADVKALLTGEVKSTLTKERVAGQVAYVPGGAGGKVEVRGRLQGLVAAKGS
ncbi:hypothetical protein [Streptomyces sp. NPDC050504]|uniref:hypothetical protein n=1 Tax=Streptomyces sp. NPDC050504 TaxID=3365618 RepID=UPI003792667C